jgi:hypothetical protein
MRSILPPLTMWVFVVWSCFILGGSVYEAVVVMPLFTSDPPRSLAADSPLRVVLKRAGMFFWSTATPGLGLVALAALLTSFSTPQPQMTWRIASTGLLLIVLAVTLLYFKPAIVNLVVHHGGGRPDAVIAAQMRRWVTLNWVRVAAVAVSIGMGVRALLLSRS